MNKFELAGIDPDDAKILTEYAKTRAKQVGESYDFILNGILSGIYRKSFLILDNLGIHAPSLAQKDDGNFGKSVAEVIKEQKLIKWQ